MVACPATGPLLLSISCGAKPKRLPCACSAASQPVSDQLSTTREQALAGGEDLQAPQALPKCSDTTRCSKPASWLLPTSPAPLPHLAAAAFLRKSESARKMSLRRASSSNSQSVRLADRSWLVNQSPQSSSHEVRPPSACMCALIRLLDLGFLDLGSRPDQAPQSSSHKVLPLRPACAL